MLAMMLTMLSHPRAVHSLEDLPDLRCALEAQIAHSCPQKPLEHPSLLHFCLSRQNPNTKSRFKNEYSVPMKSDILYLYQNYNLTSHG
jgi:hypothetical protein